MNFWVKELIGRDIPGYRDYLRQKKRDAYLSGRRARELEGESATNPYQRSTQGNSHLMDAWVLGWREGRAPEPDESKEAMRG
jgi:hypothetical protein